MSNTVQPKPMTIDSAKPSIDNVDFNDQKQAAQFQRDTAAYNLMVQTMMQTQTEESTTKSNMAKNRHDAMMAIISNFKG